MESNNRSFQQLSDHLRLQSISSNDSWSFNNGFGSKRPDQRRNFDIRVGGGLSQINNNKAPNPTSHDQSSEFNVFNDGWKVELGLNLSPQSFVNGGYPKPYMNQGYYGNFQMNYSSVKGEDHHFQNHNNNFLAGAKKKKKEGKKENRDENNKNSVDKRFKTLPPAEALPKDEIIGGYIFVCNNDTMEENLNRQLFGLPPRFCDSIRAITPGLPLFLYNYSTHQLHGIFEATSFGGSNIDSSAWEDMKHHGESRFPAQVRVQTRKLCEPLDEDEFRPILHHYDGPKFRLELSVPEVLSLLDGFGKKKDA